MAYYFSYDANQLYNTIEQNSVSNVIEKLYTKNELHCTMLFSNEEYQKQYNKLKFEPIEVEVKELAIWNNNGNFFIVAKIIGEKLYENHNKIKEEFSVRDDGNFTPHITLQKVQSEKDLMDLTELQYLIGQKITLTGFRCIPMKKKTIEPLKKLKL